MTVSMTLGIQPAVARFDPEIFEFSGELRDLDTQFGIGHCHAFALLRDGNQSDTVIVVA